MLDVRCLSVLFATVLVSACTPPAMPPPAPANPPSMDKPKMMVQRGQGSASASSASRGALASESPMQLQVDLYQLSVPFGAVSRNEQFWKHVDEQVVDVATYDLLYKNGVRVGQAPIADWEYFRQIMQQYPTFTKANTLVGIESKPVERPMRKDIRSQNIFYFDSSNEPQGRSFDECENVIALSFQPAPRKPQTMRLALCPVIRATRKHLEYSAMNNEMGEVKYVAPERMYDMNLRTDVPADHFFIVAPSPQSSRTTSVGNAFLVSNGAAEQMETVLLIVPRAVHLEEAAIKQK